MHISTFQPAKKACFSAENIIPNVVFDFLEYIELI